jgi:hypothetical protein
MTLNSAPHALWDLDADCGSMMELDINGDPRHPFDRVAAKVAKPHP